MGKIEQNKERKRQAILSAAFETFISAGYVNTSMDKIAENAQVTKQTVYRYFPSKEALFKATLEKIGEHSEFGFLKALELPEIDEALLTFAKGFIRAHLHPDHLASFRLLIAESHQVPEIASIFHGVGPDKTDLALTDFFTERLNIADPEQLIQLWTGMLLSLRTGVLMGMPHPTVTEVDEHAKQATHFLRSALSRSIAYDEA